MSVPYQRAVAHIKHVGAFSQIHYGRVAERHGFDDALLTGVDGLISEAAISNIGFYDGASVIWPDAPCLPGITMQLLQTGLRGIGMPMRQAPVRLADLAAYRSAFVTNSLGITPVSRVDDLTLPIDVHLFETLTGTYGAVAWDRI
jgi:branched-subunit amino acid aminotransferase/4-amino-4-deoxychorismate lyase